MKLGVLLVVVWLLTGLGAVAGSIFGGAAGQTGLFAGAVAGGAVVAYLAPALCSRFGWIAADAKRSASIGALIGFLIAAPIAATNLRTPVIPVLICSLAGVGAVVGARRVALADHVEMPLQRHEGGTLTARRGRHPDDQVPARILLKLEPVLIRPRTHVLDHGLLVP